MNSWVLASILGSSVLGKDLDLVLSMSLLVDVSSLYFTSCLLYSFSIALLPIKNPSYLHETQAHIKLNEKLK